MQTMTQSRVSTITCLCVLGILALVGSLVLVGGAQADYYSPGVWSASAATAVPVFLSTGTVNSFTVSTSHGWGVKSKGATTSTIPPKAIPARLFIPVTAPEGVGFDTLWLRAQDNTGGRAVTASFYRQPQG